MYSANDNEVSPSIVQSMRPALSVRHCSCAPAVKPKSKLCATFPRDIMRLRAFVVCASFPHISLIVPVDARKAYSVCRNCELVGRHTVGELVGYLAHFIRRFPSHRTGIHVGVEVCRHLEKLDDAARCGGAHGDR